MNEIIPRPATDFSIVPGSVRSAAPVARRQQLVTANKAAVTAAIDEMLKRSGLTKAEVARRLGVSRASVTQNSLGSQTPVTGADGKVRQAWRKPSVEWLARVAAICGARIVVEYPDRAEEL